MIGIFFATCRHFFFVVVPSVSFHYPPLWFRSCSFVDGFLRVVVFPIACFSLVSFASDASLGTRFLSCTCCTFGSSSSFFFSLVGSHRLLVTSSDPFFRTSSYLFSLFSSWFSSVDVARLVPSSTTLFFYPPLSFRWIVGTYVVGPGTRRGTPTPHTATPLGPPPLAPLESNVAKEGTTPHPLSPSLSPSHRDQGRLGVVRMGVVRDPRSLLHAPMEEPLLPRKEGGMGSNRNQEGRGK